MHKVDMIVRSDHFYKNGGDSEQVRQYLRCLESDFDFQVLPFSPDMKLRNGAIVHIVNIDRPFDFLSAVAIAGSRPVVVSSIHHSLTRVRLMRKAERGRGLRSVLDRWLPESTREWLAHGVRSFRSGTSMRTRFASAVSMVRHAHKMPRVWRHVGLALDSAFAVAVLAPGEAEDIKKDTSWSGRNSIVIPNGRPDETRCHDWSTRRRSVIAVGRVEPRKRSLDLARAADRLEIHVTFVGPVSDDGSDFAKEFAHIASSSPYVESLGALTHEEVLEILADTRVLINASWVEVQSLVDLEAAMSGARVVTFKNGNSSDWLGHHVIECKTFDIDELLRVAQDESMQSSAPGIAQYDWTWQRASESLRDIYLEAYQVRTMEP